MPHNNTRRVRVRRGHTPTGYAPAFAVDSLVVVSDTPTNDVYKVMKIFEDPLAEERKSSDSHMYILKSLAREIEQFSMPQQALRAATAETIDLIIAHLRSAATALSYIRKTRFGKKERESRADRWRAQSYIEEGTEVAEEEEDEPTPPRHPVVDDEEFVEEIEEEDIPYIERALRKRGPPIPPRRRR